MPEATNVDPKEIEPSPHNPRLIFAAEELERLRESIDEVGILVPLTVYRTPEGTLRLIDGERRLTCALQLGLEAVPCYIVDDVDETTELEWMFSIHMMKEDWAQGPIAKALRQLAERVGGWNIEKLKAVSGLTTQQIAFYKALADAPTEILERVIAGDLPANLVADAVLRVANPLRAELPDLAADKSDEEFIKLMVKKRDAGNLPDVVKLRQLRTMISVAAEDSGSGQDKEDLKQVINQVVEDPGFSIEEAYEDTVGTRVALQAFKKTVERFAKSAKHAAHDAQNDAAQSAALADELEALAGRLMELVSDLRGTNEPE